MRSRAWLLLSAFSAACGLFPSLDGLTGGDAAVAPDSAAPDSATDATNDVTADVTASSDASDAPAVVCDGGLTACGVDCVDVSNNASNCGACGHDCLGGGCIGGKCQPLTMVNAQNGAYDIAVGGGEAYWTNNNDGSVAKCSTSNCGATLTVLATGRNSPEDIAIDGTNVYWSEQGGVGLCARAGCSQQPTALVSGKTAADGGAISYDGIAVGPSLVYFPMGGSLLGCATTGCGNNPTTVTSSGADDLTVDGTNLYGAAGSSVFKCPLANCSNATRTSIVTGLSGGESVAVDSKNVYFTYSGSVGSCPLTGCGTPTVLAANLTSPNDIATDGVDVYWVDDVDDTVLRCAVSGCGGNPTVLATNQSTPKGIALDANAVYWTSAGGDAVVKLAK